MKRAHVRIFVVVGLLAAGAGIWWLERDTRPAAKQTPPANLAHSSQAASTGPSFNAPLHSATEPQPSTTGTDEPGAAKVTVGDILAEPGDDYLKIAQKLGALVSDATRPLAEREEALAHTMNLSVGNEAEVLTPLVQNPAVPDSLAETILSEALNRPLSYQADLYLAALAVRKEAKIQEMIRQHLAFLTSGPDRGADPKAWVDAIKTAKAGWAP